MKKITIYILLTLMMSTIFIISPNAETICADGYYLFNEQCLSCSQKKAHCQLCKYDTSVICTKCIDGYFLANGSCTGCSAISNCTECSSTTKKCTRCREGYYVKGLVCAPCEAGSFCPNGIDISSCPVGTYSEEKSSACTNCSYSFVIREQVKK